METLSLAVEFDDQEEYPDYHCPRGVDRRSLCSGGILGHGNTKTIEESDRETNGNAETDKGMICAKVLESTHSIFKFVIGAKVRVMAGDRLKDGE